MLSVDCGTSRVWNGLPREPMAAVKYITPIARPAGIARNSCKLIPTLACVLPAFSFAETAARAEDEFKVSETAFTKVQARVEGTALAAQELGV